MSLLMLAVVGLFPPALLTLLLATSQLEARLVPQDPHDRDRARDRDRDGHEDAHARGPHPGDRR